MLIQVCKIIILERYEKYIEHATCCGVCLWIHSLIQGLVF